MNYWFIAVAALWNSRKRNVIQNILNCNLISNLEYVLQVNVNKFKSGFMKTIKSEKLKPIMQVKWINNVKYIKLSGLLLSIKVTLLIYFEILMSIWHFWKQTGCIVMCRPVEIPSVERKADMLVFPKWTLQILH